MVKPKSKHMNSKRGFALATVLVVSCVIIILATSLISVAMFSTKSTSGDVNERQAYLNQPLIMLQHIMRMQTFLRL